MDAWPPVVAIACWTRLDLPGCDVCRLVRLDAGWRLQGTAIFVDHGIPTVLDYVSRLDADWQAEGGHVTGWLGAIPVSLAVDRPDGEWTLNGEAVPGLEACVDLDFGFTPATNLTQLRRIQLAVGGRADVPAAWLDVAHGTLGVLPQRYERRSKTTYWYEAPSVSYAGLLEVDDAGFCTHYPELWRVVVA